MNLLLLLPYALDTAPSQRFRIEQWIPHLQQAGVQVDAKPLLTLEEQRTLHRAGNTAAKTAFMTRAMLARLGHLRGVRRYDAVWLHRAAWPIGPAIVEHFLARLGVPVLFEFDDAIYLTHTAAANLRFQALKCAGKTGEICRLSAHVVTGNEYLAQYARQFNAHVTVIPTTIDTDWYRPREHYPASSPVVIGWSGSRTTAPHLRTIDRAIQRVAAEEPIRLHVIGAGDYALEGVDVRSAEWSASEEVTELERFDIGVMPLPDEEWARGKCALKALQYMALGVPTVTSPVGVNGDIIRHGENGALVRTEDEWVEQLLALCRDRALRERLGRAGARTVEAEFSARAQAPRVHRLLQEVIGQRRSTQPAPVISRSIHDCSND